MSAASYLALLESASMSLFSTHVCTVKADAHFWCGCVTFRQYNNIYQHFATYSNQTTVAVPVPFLWKLLDMAVKAYLLKFIRKICQIFYYLLTLPSPCISEGCIKIKINLNFYFQTSFWCLRRLYEGFYGLHKTVGGTTRSVEIKVLVNFLCSFQIGTGKVKLIAWYF